MRSSCVICFLAVALCLVVCVSASTTVTQADTTREVTAAKEAVTAVCARAQSELDKANRLLDKVELSKREASDAKVKSQKAPQDNTDAVEIAKSIKSLSEDVDKLYPEAKEKLVNAVKRLSVLREEAQKLNGKSEITIMPNEEPSDDYTETNNKAVALKLEASELDGNITEALTLFTGVDATANSMAQKAKEAQIKDFQVNVVVSVATMKSMLENADDIILQIEEKEREVSVIVDEMKKLKTNPATVSDENIKALHTNAANALAAATGAVHKAKRAKAAIQTQKGLADTALTKVKAETNDVSKAQNEANTAEECVTAAQLIVPQLDNALQTAKDSVTNANNFKENLKTALSTTTTAPSTVQSTETEKANPPVGEGTEPNQKDTTMQPTSKELPTQSNDSAEEIKDALSKGAKNVTTTALIGGKVPAPGAKNDSAMTVSVPLLVALIASAVWQ